jgi:hypothetical protein
MSEVVVTENTGAILTTLVDTQTVITQGSTDSVIVTGALGPPGPQGPQGAPAPDTFELSDLRDIDLSQLGNGSTLVYNVITNAWAATNTLSEQIVECGQF